ncbi:mitochondrial co-chaperone GrpE, putative [Talaromyces stipitatus ATCC 10500]|uniref:GrpE protein homolog, mitochondrial n=1 Tax=Talaromyces stipitatus (strain ATCC 10500 / CBS 375.48 / QM 6759 / NRRL 1006) TaxID=441959 RepID=B8M3P3_TALSN|nr:mitochondrial co-chaperone GrpE, putative [Talaromyces stipitatus ATCC 10500]EED22415.1 mitochondrial co-chaperone GrpE, putative [Talaromyces stipitatus ATCC 10500]
MLQRTILRQRRAVFSSINRATIPSSPLRQSSPFQQLALKQSAFRFTPRLYSTENGTKQEDAKKENGEGSEKPAESPEDALKKELEVKDKEIVDLKDKYLRSVADFRNLQERTRRDMDNARSFAIQKFAVDLLESIDNFDRALSVVPAEKLNNDQSETNKDLQELHQGLKMTENILLSTLKKHGLERFDPSETADGKPQKFDPKLHEATFMAKAEGRENGDIMFVQSKGYSLNGRVLRAS